LVALLGTTVPVSVSGKVAVAVVGMPTMLVTGTKVACFVKVNCVEVADSVPAEPVTAKEP